MSSLEPTDPSVRASDADRDSVAERLREAHAEGRLSVDEFGERLDGAYAARTHGDLLALTSDLPVPVVAGARTGGSAAVQHVGAGRGPALRGAWAVWATAVLVNLVIWGAVSVSAEEAAYFWPMWVAGPWGAVLLARTIFGANG